MIYDIGCTIAYDYDRPAIAGRHILRLLPADLPGVQRRITGLLAIQPHRPSAGPLIDFFGNSGVEIAFRAEHDEILFRVTARVERLAEAPELDISPTSPASAPRSSTTAASTPTPRITFSASSPRTAPPPR